MEEYYDRYRQFRFNDTVGKVPFLRIKEEGTDLYVTYDKYSMRMDSLSYKYYGDPNFGWLILQANPSLPPYEFAIDNGVTLRIPYPLDSAVRRYEASIADYVNNGVF